MRKELSRTVEVEVSPADMDGLASQEAERRLVQFGRNEIVERETPFLLKIAVELWQPIPWMLEAAIVLQIALGERLEASVIGALLLFNVALSYFQQSKAQAALTILKSKLSVKATVKRDGAWKEIRAPELAPGDVIKLELGALVPADARVLEGSVLLDQSMLTGESAPVEVTAGGAAYAGALARRGAAIALVTATGARSFYGKTAELVRVAGAQSAEQKAVLGVVRNLAAFNGAITVLLIAYGHSLSLTPGRLIELALTAVLGSIPVALPATFTLAAALGAQALAKKGVLLTRLAAVHEAAMVDVVCVDKTGTLTSNELAVAAVRTLTTELEPNDILSLAVLASASEGFDPVDTAIRTAAAQSNAKRSALHVCSFTPFDPATKLAEALVGDDAGTTSRVVKGAPHAIARLSPFGARAEQEIEELSRTAGRVIAVAFGPAQAEKLVGLIALSDPPRPESKPLIADLKAQGVRTVMVTGDAAATAASVGRAVGLSGPVCPAAKISEDANPDDYAIYAGVFPEDKFKLVQSFQRRGHIVGMCGDGANDAPALRQAQMGVAVSTATDVAKSAASIVLTEPGLKGVVVAIVEGRTAFQRILTYTLNALVKKFQLVPFLGVGLLATGHTLVTPMQMALLLITGDFLTMAIATDRATPSARPDAWRVGATTGAALSLAFTGLLFLSAVVVVGQRRLALAIPELRTLCFLALVFLGQAMVYVLRDRQRLWSSAPSKWLAASSIINIALAALLARAGWLMAPLLPAVIGELLLATLIFAIVLDFVKALVFAQFGLGARAQAPPEVKREPLSWLASTVGALGAAGAAALSLWLWYVLPPPVAATPRVSAAQWATFEGKIAAPPERRVTAPQEGTVGALDCPAGERVQAGRLCAAIYERSHEHSPVLESAERNLERDERLARGPEPRRLRRSLLLRIRKERSEIAKLRGMQEQRPESARRTEIRAPFDAVVVARYVSSGQSVSASAPLFLFTRESQTVRVEINVPQKELKELRIGAHAELISSSAPERISRGEVTELSASAGGEGPSAMGFAIVEAPNSGVDFAVGSRVTARIEGRPNE